MTEKIEAPPKPSVLVQPTKIGFRHDDGSGVVVTLGEVGAIALDDPETGRRGDPMPLLLFGVLQQLQRIAIATSATANILAVGAQKAAAMQAPGAMDETMRYAMRMAAEFGPQLAEMMNAAGVATHTSQPPPTEGG